MQAQPTNPRLVFNVPPPSTVQCNFPPNCGFVGSVKDTVEHFFTHVPRNRFQCKKCSIQFFTMESFLKHGSRYRCHASEADYNELTPSKSDLTEYNSNWNSYIKILEPVEPAQTLTVISPVLSMPHRASSTSSYQPMAGQYSRLFGSTNGRGPSGPPATHESQPAPAPYSLPASVPCQPTSSSEAPDDEIIVINLEPESPVYVERDYSKLHPSWRQYPEPTEPYPGEEPSLENPPGMSVDVMEPPEVAEEQMEHESTLSPDLHTDSCSESDPDFDLKRKNQKQTPEEREKYDEIMKQDLRESIKNFWEEAGETDVHFKEYLAKNAEKIVGRYLEEREDFDSDQEEDDEMDFEAATCLAEESSSEEEDEEDEEEEEHYNMDPEGFSTYRAYRNADLGLEVPLEGQEAPQGQPVPQSPEFDDTRPTSHVYSPGSPPMDNYPIEDPPVPTVATTSQTPAPVSPLMEGYPVEEPIRSQEPSHTSQNQFVDYMGKPRKAHLPAFLENGFLTPPASLPNSARSSDEHAPRKAIDKRHCSSTSCLPGKRMAPPAPLSNSARNSNEFAPKKVAEKRHSLPPLGPPGKKVAPAPPTKSPIKSPVKPQANPSAKKGVDPNDLLGGILGAMANPSKLEKAAPKIPKKFDEFQEILEKKRIMMTKNIPSEKKPAKRNRMLKK